MVSFFSKVAGLEYNFTIKNVMEGVFSGCFAENLFHKTPPGDFFFRSNEEKCGPE